VPQGRRGTRDASERGPAQQQDVYAAGHHPAAAAQPAAAGLSAGGGKLRRLPSGAQPQAPTGPSPRGASKETREAMQGLGLGSGRAAPQRQQLLDSPGRDQVAEGGGPAGRTLKAAARMYVGSRVL
jgi:hypothetical protein